MPPFFFLLVQHLFAAVARQIKVAQKTLNYAFLLNSYLSINRNYPRCLVLAGWEDPDIP